MTAAAPAVMEITRREQEEAVQAPPTLSAAQALARFARRQMEAPTTPERVTNKTMQLVVDQIGLQLGCAELPWSRAVHDYIASFSALGPATVVAYGGRCIPSTPPSPTRHSVTGRTSTTRACASRPTWEPR